MMSASSPILEKDVRRLLENVDGSGSGREWAAIGELRKLGSGLVQHLQRRFDSARSWKTRSACVFHAMRYAQESEDAVSLGLLAIKDRSAQVRYRGAMLLAHAQRKDTLPALREALAGEDCDGARRDLAAAVDAVEAGNPDYFVDRTHSGKVKLTVG